MLFLWNDFLMRTRNAADRFLRDEEGDVNIVSMVVLIGIAVLLAAVFKDQITDLLNTLFNTIQNTATNTIT